VGSRTASEAIAEDLRSRIATRQLQVGDRLPSERALLEQYQVARPTMRGALRILESDGLINIERGTNGGARVVEPDLAPLARRVGLHLQLRGTDLDELIAAEVVMQPGAVAMAAAAHDAEDVARLRRAADRSGAATTMDDYLGAVADFTDALLHAAHNNALSLYAELTGALVREGLGAMVVEQAIELEMVEDLVAKSTRAFHGVIDLIEADDAAGAESYWRTYLQETGASPTPGPSPLEVYAPDARR